MFQYRMFLLKEWRQLRRNKKVILYCFLFSFFMPLMNYLATGPNPPLGNPLLPIDFLIPFYLIIAGLIPCELTSDIMNDEFDTKSYEILAVSKINKRIIIFSKITIPILLGIIISLVSIMINNSLPGLTGKDVFVHSGDLSYYLFLILSLMYASLFYILLIEGKQKRLPKDFLTLIAGIVMYGCLFPVYILYYFKLRWLAIIILMIVSGGMYYLSSIGFHHLHPLVKRKKKQKIKFANIESRFGILYKKSYCHYWNGLKAGLFLLVIIMMSFSCRPYVDESAFVILFSLFPVVQYLLISNNIILNSTLLEIKMNGLLHMKLSKISSVEFICSRLLYPVVFNSLITIILQTILLQNLFNLSAILNYFSMNLFVCLLTLFLSMLVKETGYLAQDKIIVFVGVITLGAILLNYKLAFIFIMFINLILYFLCSRRYQKI